MYVTLISYNAALVIMSVEKAGIIYVHHYYLTFYISDISLIIVAIVIWRILKTSSSISQEDTKSKTI